MCKCLQCILFAVASISILFSGVSKFNSCCCSGKLAGVFADEVESCCSSDSDEKSFGISEFCNNFCVGNQTRVPHVSSQITVSSTWNFAVPVLKAIFSQPLPEISKLKNFDIPISYYSTTPRDYLSKLRILII